jgi:predicted double-glycine peptidase
MEAEPDIQEQVKKLLSSFDLPYYLKWKDNKIINQRANSSNCGWFCIQFLLDRFEGKPFKDSTGYSNVNKSERDLKQRFGYLM